MPIMLVVDVIARNRAPPKEALQVSPFLLRILVVLFVIVVTVQLEYN